MSIETRLKTLERTLERRHNLLYQKPFVYLIKPAKGETSEQARERYELEHNIKIQDRDLLIILAGDE